jgi:uncharacterized protein
MMIIRRVARSIAAALPAFCIFAIAPSDYAVAASSDAVIVNRGVVELETGRSNELSVQMAEEIADIIDDGVTRRVVPVVGKGPLRNLADLKYLRGLDLAIVPADALDQVREQRLMPGIEASLSYIAKLYNEEFHLLARRDIAKFSDLSGQTVNVDVQNSSTALTATRLFQLLNVQVKLATDEQPVALEKLRSGKIAALAVIAAKPSQFVQKLKIGDSLHFLSLPLPQAIMGAYAPSQLTSSDYPDLVQPDRPVDTIAVGRVLMAADLRGVPERYRNISNFVDALFTRFEDLRSESHHPKWQEVNIAAEVSGWGRHPAAQQWLQRNAQVANAASPDALRALFSRFVDERRQASGGGPMSAAEKDTLFQQFRAWQHGQAQ